MDNCDLQSNLLDTMIKKKIGKTIGIINIVKKIINDIN